MIACDLVLYEHINFFCSNKSDGTKKITSFAVASFVVFPWRPRRMIWRSVCQKNALKSARWCRQIYSGERSERPFWNRKSPAPGVSSRFLLSSPGASTSLDMKLNLKNSYGTTKLFYSSQAWVDLPTGGIVEVPLAQTGEGIAECELLKWFVKEGDHVEEFQPLCEVQSDKASIEITSRYKGKVSQVLFVPGDIVKVGEALLKIVVEEIQHQAVNSDGLGNTVAVSHEAHQSDCQSSLLIKEKADGVLSTPSVRHLARKYGLNINDIVGTGKDGRVLKEDVFKYAFSKEKTEDGGMAVTMQLEEVKSSYLDSVDEQQHQDKTVPLRGFQRAMIKSMTMAAKVPHFHYIEEINCDALVELKEAFQNEKSDSDVKHTFLPFLIKSLSMALSKYPLLNSIFNEESNEIIYKGYHNIGVAMATPYGLAVPNIKKIQSLSILQITKELCRLQQMALNNKLASEDISGGTITVSNIGAIGGKFGSPLLNLPEVAIVAIGRIQKLPRFTDDGTVYPASLTNVTIGADHRVVDGATVARFCNEWKQLIEKPELLLLHLR